MAKFLAVTSKGLKDTLKQELSSFSGIQIVDENPSAVYFEGPWRECYRANLSLRTASRVLYSILDFPAYTNDDLYHNIKKHDFTKYISPEQSIAVDASVSESGKLKDQRFVAMLIKDAICDQFREKTNARPSVNVGAPDLKIVAKILKNQVNISLDTSGAALFQRAYRKEREDASLKETLAAALVQYSGWDGSQILMDPTCGAGSIVIEAALLARKIIPGGFRKGFAFQKWKNYQEDSFQQVFEELIAEEDESLMPKILAYDVSGKAIANARKNATSAGVDDCIQFERKNIFEIELPEGTTGVMILNPPYGERLGTTDSLRDFYKDLGYILKQKFKGWDVWMLSGNPELSAQLRLKAERKIPVWNGPIECRLLHYSIR